MKNIRNMNVSQLMVFPRLLTDTGHNRVMHRSNPAALALVADAPAAARRQRRRRRSEDLILDAATRMFLERGVVDTTMQHIAEAADVAQGTLYNYFPNKESLTIAVVRKMMKVYGRALLDHEMTRGDLDPLDIVASATIRLITQGVSDPFWRVLVERYDVLADALHDELQEFAMRNLGAALRLKLLPATDDSLAMLWRLGAWVIAGAIRDIVNGHLAEDRKYLVAVHVLMQQGIDQGRATAIVRRIRSRLAREVKAANALR
jgi:AcrR family transcriptional regulator